MCELFVLDLKLLLRHLLPPQNLGFFVSEAKVHRSELRSGEVHFHQKKVPKKQTQVFPSFLSLPEPSIKLLSTLPEMQKTFHNLRTFGKAILFLYKSPHSNASLHFFALWPEAGQTRLLSTWDRFNANPRSDSNPRRQIFPTIEHVATRTLLSISLQYISYPDMVNGPFWHFLIFWTATRRCPESHEGRESSIPPGLVEPFCFSEIGPFLSLQF